MLTLLLFSFYPFIYKGYKRQQSMLTFVDVY